MSRIWFAAVAALGAVAIALVPQAGAFNPQPDSPGFQALRPDDINALPAVQNSQPFLAKTLAAREAALRGQPCVAMNQLGARFATRSLRSSGRRGPRTRWGGIERGRRPRADVRALLQDPIAAACGGITAPSNDRGETAGRRDVQRRQRADPARLVPAATFTPRLGDGRSISTWEWTASARPASSASRTCPR